MKSFVALALFVAVAAAASVSNPDGAAEILSLENSNSGLPEGYKYGFSASNGIEQAEQGALKNVGTEQEALSVSGSYKYVDPEGHVHVATYTADERGFQPISDDIPQSA